MTVTEMATKINRKTNLSITESNSEEESEQESDNFENQERGAGHESDSENQERGAGHESDSENQDSGSDDNIDNEDDDDTVGSNPAWADSIAKILKTNKPKNKRTLVLSKAKKINDVIKKEKPEDIGFQIDGEIKEEKIDVDKLNALIEKSCEEGPPEKKRKEIPNIRVKPNILDKDRERTLAKIATRGVVQLFNSVRMQQKEIDAKLQEAGPLERKRENALKSIDKRAFLDVLMQKKSQPVDGEVKSESVKEENKKPTWNVLRDDFMMGGKLKDWDKDLEEEDNESMEELSDSN